ncbi:hypothetical protein JSO54_09000 [Riemerella anatipestifer]|uniref:hypothetical protein n=1 Tax=Riemerella anatipestifer TaxID=34085 RepID=UPI001374E16E|nr:hypothetical protein [Riemerella anatipestifer]
MDKNNSLIIDNKDFQLLEQSFYGDILNFDMSHFNVENSNRKKVLLNKLYEESLKIPAFIDFINKLKDNGRLYADISSKTKELIDNGELFFKYTEKGNISAILRDINGRFSEHITLKSENFSPETISSLANIALQMQLAQVMSKLKDIQETVDKILQGQKDDRVALCESALYQLLLSLKIKNYSFKKDCISNAIKTISDGKMQILYSMKRNIEYINNAEYGFWSSNQDKVDKEMIDLQKNLSIYIKSSYIEAMLFLTANENSAALNSMNMCVSILNKNIDEAVRNNLHENMGKSISNNKRIDINFWINTYPEIINNISSKIEFLDTKINNDNLIY